MDAAAEAHMDVFTAFLRIRAGPRAAEPAGQRN